MRVTEFLKPRFALLPKLVEDESGRSVVCWLRPYFEVCESRIVTDCELGPYDTVHYPRRRRVAVLRRIDKEARPAGMQVRATWKDYEAVE